MTFLQTLHGVAADAGEAAGLALAAGIDVELPTVDCYGEPLASAVEAGRVDEALVDRALERVLLQKCELGLLDADWSPEPADEEPIELDDAGRARWRGGSRGARSCCSTTTARCRCAPGARVAVVGPRADAAAR